MDRADARRRPGQRDVDRFGELRFELRVAEPVDRAGERRFHPLDGGVDHFAGVGAFGGRQRADAAPDRGDLAAAAEKCDAQLLERAFVGDAGELGGEPVFERREVRSEVRHSERRCWTKQNARSFDQAFLRGIMTVRVR